MKLHNATLDYVPGLSGLHVGTAESSELVRLLTEPNAVLREVGLNITADAPSPIVVVPGADATPSAIVVIPILDGGNIIKWVGVVIIDGDVIEVLSGPKYEK